MHLHFESHFLRNFFVLVLFTHTFGASAKKPVVGWVYFQKKEMISSFHSNFKVGYMKAFQLCTPKNLNFKLRSQFF